MSVVAALVAGAIGSSASAQTADPQECEDLAWTTCHPDPSVPWNPYSFRCWNETYEACMNGGPAFAAYGAVRGARSAVRLASRPVVTVRSS